MITANLLHQACAQLGCPATKANLLGGYSQNVYEIDCGKKLVIKFVKSSANGEQAIRSEIEWLDYLHDNGLSVVKPYHVTAGSGINRITEEFFIVAYEKVAGIHIDPSDKTVWNRELFVKWGAAMGKMHVLAKAFTAQHRRPQWFENDLFSERHLSALEPEILKRLQQHHSDFSKLPTTAGVYGLIHGDLTHHNLLYTDHQVTLIDFGDSEYNWFAYDIAVSIYHAAQTVKDEAERLAFAKMFAGHFLDGYAREHTGTECFSQMDAFLDYRHLFSYAYHSVFADRSQLTEQQKNALRSMRDSLLASSSYFGSSVLPN